MGSLDGSKNQWRRSNKIVTNRRQEKPQTKFLQNVAKFEKRLVVKWLRVLLHPPGRVWVWKWVEDGDCPISCVRGERSWKTRSAPFLKGVRSRNVPAGTGLGYFDFEVFCFWGKLLSLSNKRVNSDLLHFWASERVFFLGRSFLQNSTVINVVNVLLFPEFRYYFSCQLKIEEAVMPRHNRNGVE